MNAVKRMNTFLLALLAAATLGLAGCTVATNGMVIPDPYYMKQRVQYFPRGTEFPFPNEAANMQNSHVETP
jgi:hypothetical protein